MKILYITMCGNFFNQLFVPFFSFSSVVFGKRLGFTQWHGARQWQGIASPIFVDRSGVLRYVASRHGDTRSYIAADDETASGHSLRWAAAIARAQKGAGSEGEQMSLALNKINAEVGPRGGDLNNPQNSPPFRKAALNVDLTEEGYPTLHKFERADVVAQGIKDEKPWHMMAAIMLIHGHTNPEIAMHAGVSVEHVKTIRAQRWFQQRLGTLANEQGQEVAGLLAAEAVASIEKLVALRDFSESDRVAAQAAQILLEHANGKPVQKSIIHTTHATAGSFKTPEEELDHLNCQIKEIRQTQNKTIDVESEQQAQPAQASPKQPQLTQ